MILTNVGWVWIQASWVRLWSLKKVTSEAESVISQESAVPTYLGMTKVVSLKYSWPWSISLSPPRMAQVSILFTVLSCATSTNLFKRPIGQTTLRRHTLDYKLRVRIVQKLSKEVTIENVSSHSDGHASHSVSVKVMIQSFI